MVWKIFPNEICMLQPVVLLKRETWVLQRAQLWHRRSNWATLRESKESILKEKMDPQRANRERWWGNSTDPAAGVAILLSNRMAGKVLDEGRVGTCIAWSRVAGLVCNIIFFIVVYILHNERTSYPLVADTFVQLEKLLTTIRKLDCIVLRGNFDCQLHRNVKGCTGKWCMTKEPQAGHGEDVLDPVRSHDLFAVDTLFKSSRKK